MNDNKTNIGTRPSAVGIAKEENKLQAVCLRKQHGTFEVLWTKSSELSDADWGTFAAECGLPAGQTTPTGKGAGNRATFSDSSQDDNPIVVAGFGSAGVGFHRITVPAAKKEEIAPMVRLQAEARLPLPAEQMELAWRPGQVQDGQMSVTVAAAKAEQLLKFIESIHGFEPEKILLDCEAIVRAWTEFFSETSSKLSVFGQDAQAAVVSVGVRNTQVCLAERRRLINAVSLDVGMRDFSAAEEAETFERFAQDMRSVLELFGYEQPAQLPVFVLSDGSAAMKRVVSNLETAGLKVATACPQIQKIKAQAELGAEDIYEYRVPIGLALMALDGDTAELNIFERLYRPAKEQLKKHWLYSLKLTGAIAAVMLAVLVTVMYVRDVTGAKRLGKLAANTNYEGLMRQYKLIQTVASQRPDLMELLDQVNTSGSGGIQLDSFHFKKGTPVRISGQLQNADQLYKFQQSLRNELLFNIDSKSQSDLDNAVISEQMRQEFKENKTPLSRHAKASVEQAGDRWVINDRLKKYLVRKEAGRLNIYVGRKNITNVTIQSASPDAKTKRLKFTINFHYESFTKRGSRGPASREGLGTL